MLSSLPVGQDWVSVLGHKWSMIYVYSCKLSVKYYWLAQIYSLVTKQNGMWPVVSCLWLYFYRTLTSDESAPLGRVLNNHHNQPNTNGEIKDIDKIIQWCTLQSGGVRLWHLSTAVNQDDSHVEQSHNALLRSCKSTKLSKILLSKYDN